LSSDCECSREYTIAIVTISPKPRPCILLALIAVVAFNVPIRAQDTREQQIVAAQAEKVQALSVEGPNREETTIVRVMKSPLLAGTGGAFPWFGSVYEGTSFALGGGYLRRMPRHSELLGIAGLSVNGSTLLRGEYTAPRLAHGTVQPFASVEWARANNVSFFGLGNDSIASQRTDFDFDPMTIKAGLGFRPARLVLLTTGVERIGFRTELTDSPASGGPLPSDNSSLQFNGFRLGATFDTREAPGYSTSGTMLRATTARYAEAASLPYNFQQSQLEAVQLVPLVREQFVLAFHALATFTDGANGDDPPLALLPYLGGGTSLRGFATRRFVDRNSLLLTGEYRWRPSRYLDMALFLDAGEVAHSFQRMDSEKLHTSWGLGARFHGPGFTALRLEFAHSVEGSRIVFTTGGGF
jgi:Omp85 superfamily domain